MADNATNRQEMKALPLKCAVSPDPERAGHNRLQHAEPSWTGLGSRRRFTSGRVSSRRQGHDRTSQTGKTASQGESSHRAPALTAS